MVAWNGAVKILDFGIARAVQELRTSQTDAGIVKGKMSYVAPELLQGQPADARSDVFSLGVVLHELLSGRRLFVGENDLETLKLVSEMPVPRPSSRNPGVKPALDEVILRALARDPAKRYQSADEMGHDLERLVLRKRYAASSFAKQVRALVPEAEAAVEPGAPVEIDFGQRDSSAVDRRGDAAPGAAATARRGARRRAGRGGSAGGRAARRARELAAVAAPHHRDAGVDGDCAPARRARAADAGRAAAAGANAGVRSAPARRRSAPSTVEMSIDSRPQGALVTTAATPSSARGRWARRRSCSGCRAARPR